MAFWRSVLSLQLFQSHGMQLWVTNKEFMEPWLQDFSSQTSSRRSRRVGTETLGNTGPSLLGSDWENWEDNQGSVGRPWMLGCLDFHGCAAGEAHGEGISPKQGLIVHQDPPGWLGTPWGHRCQCCGQSHALPIPVPVLAVPVLIIPVLPWPSLILH